MVLPKFCVCYLSGAAVPRCPRWRMCSECSLLNATLISSYAKQTVKNFKSQQYVSVAAWEDESYSHCDGVKQTFTSLVVLQHSFDFLCIDLKVPCGVFIYIQSKPPKTRCICPRGLTNVLNAFSSSLNI